MDTTLEFIARWQAWVYPGLALYAAVKSGLLPLFAAAAAATGALDVGLVFLALFGGTVVGEDEAINLVGCLTAQTVKIKAGGHLIAGGNGVVADADGVILDGAGSVLNNAGSILAYGSAISAIVQDNSVMQITNSGDMHGRVAGIWHKFGNGVLNFTNTGTISSDSYAFLGGDSADHIINRGTMTGAIDLGGGDDSFYGCQGSVDGQRPGAATQRSTAEPAVRRRELASGKAQRLQGRRWPQFCGALVG
mgnify:CR=1 FL=1